jgi:hypothetical protein
VIPSNVATIPNIRTVFVSFMIGLPFFGDVQRGACAVHEDGVDVWGDGVCQIFVRGAPHAVCSIHCVFFVIASPPVLLLRRACLVNRAGDVPKHDQEGKGAAAVRK